MSEFESGGGRPQNHLPSLDDVPVNPSSASMSATPMSLEPDSGFDIRGLLETVGRKFMRGALWFGGLFLVFLIAAWVSLPTDAIAWRISHEARKAGFNITIEEVSLRPWGSATLEGVSWNLAPSRPTSTPVPFVIEELDVSFSVLKYLLFDDLDIEFEGRLDEGMIRGAYVSGDDSKVSLEISDLPLYGVPKLQDSVNAPVRGLFALKVDLEAPNNEWAKASGSLEVHCASCTIGDGETKLYVPSAKASSMLSKGVTIPMIDLGTLDGVLQVKDGKAIADEFGNESEDILIRISGDITFKDPIGKSRLNLLIKILMTDKLRESSDNVELLVATASPKVKMDPPNEGWIAMVLEGNFKNRRFRGIKQLTKAQAQRAKRDASRKRAADRAERRAVSRAERAAVRAETDAAAIEAEKQAASGESAGDPTNTNPPDSGEPVHRIIPPEVGVLPEPSADDEGGDEAADEAAGEEGAEEEEEEEGGEEEEEAEEEEGEEKEEGGDEIGGSIQ